MTDLPEPEESVARLEAELALPRGFFRRLLETEDDWSFVIKLQALVEAALSHHLRATAPGATWLAAFPKARVTDKVKFASALELFNEGEAYFIRILSEIRNDFVHDVRKAGMSLVDYVAAMDDKRVEDLRRAIGPGGAVTSKSGVAISEVEFVRQQPRLAAWMRALFYLALVYEGRTVILIAKERDAAYFRLAETTIRLSRLQDEIQARLVPPPEGS